MQPANIVSDDQIRRRAFELWEQRGCPSGHDAEFWAQAERELKLGENRRGVSANAAGGRSGSGSESSRQG